MHWLFGKRALAFGLIGVGALGIGALSWRFYLASREEVLSVSRQNIEAIAELKVRQIESWRGERLGDAALLSENPLNALRIQHFLEQPLTADGGEDLRDWLKSYASAYHYAALTLRDAQGRIRLRVGDSGRDDPIDRAFGAEAQRTRKPLLSDLHRSGESGFVHLGLYTPLLVPEGSGKPTACVGVLESVIDPEIYLYPLIQTWPTPSATGETMLVRREGNSLLYLNELRHLKGTALALRDALSLPRLPAAVAGRSYEGLLDGTDYRGVGVLAAVRRVPDSSWILIAKQDYAEVIRPFQVRVATFLAVMLSGLGTAGLLALLGWKRREASFFRRQYELERERIGAEERYRALYETMVQGVVWMDAKGAVLSANPAAELILGLSSEEMRGRTPLDPRWRTAREDGSPLPGAEHPSMVALRTGRKAEGMIMGVFHPGEGKRRWVSVSAVPQFVAGREEPFQVFATFEDITERLRTAEELRVAKEAAEEANRAKGSFLATISHEIRTPMNAILGFCQLLRDDAGLSAQQVEYLQVISRSGEHLLGLINDLLEISKIEAGRVTLASENFDLRAVIGDMEAMFHERLRVRGLSMVVEGLGCVPRWLVGDEGKLRQILINLIGNAKKFTERGGVLVGVNVVSHEGQGVRLAFRVEDSGPGIPEEERAKLFQPFQQTSSGLRTHSGTGLGLAICRRYVELMGGEIGLRSREGGGSVFFFEIAFGLGRDPAGGEKESRAAGTGREARPLPEGPATPGDLAAALPEDLTQSLREAALGGDQHGLLELEDTVAEHDPALATRLSSLAQEYAYPEILKILSPSGGGQ